ncbi:MAG: PRC-barrel domain-containing protein [Roseiflexaceae bacterium]
MMHKVNDLFGVEVINQTTGERIAPVRDVVLAADLRQIAALVLSPGGLFSDELVVRWPTIISRGDVIVVAGTSPLLTIKQDTEIADLRKLAVRITGVAVITATGDQLGTVSDIGFDDQGRVLGYEITHGILGGLTGHRFLPSECVQSVGKDAIITTTAELSSVKEFERALGEQKDAES